MAGVWEQRATLQPAAEEILWGRADSGRILALAFNCSFTVPSPHFVHPLPTNISNRWTEAAGQEALGHKPAPSASGSCHFKTHNLNPKSQTCFSLHFPDNHMQYTSPSLFDRGQSECKCTYVKDRWGPASQWASYWLLRFNSVNSR